MNGISWNPNILDGKTVLITGGTGSFGRKLLDCLIGAASPKKIIIFSRDEYKQFEMAQVYPSKNIHLFAISSVMCGTRTVFAWLSREWISSFTRPR